MIVVSACLAGVNCTYKGSNNLVPEIKKLVEEGKAIMVCPEELGGLPTPRTPCEIISNKVISEKGEDFTKEFIKGAGKALEIALKNNCDTAIIKARSPSCGYKETYDGTFTHTLIKKNGVFAELLEKNKFKMYTEENFINHINNNQ